MPSGHEPLTTNAGLTTAHAGTPAGIAVAAPERDPRASTTLLVALIGTILLLAVVLTALLLVQDAEWTRNQGDVNALSVAERALGRRRRRNLGRAGARARIKG